MATTHGPDLEAARKAVERLMDDTCAVYRGVDDSSSDVLDPDTGVLVSAPMVRIYPTQAMIDADPDMETLGGPVSFRTVGEGFTTTQTRVQGGDAETYRMFNVRTPINDSPSFLEGDLMVCITSRRDPTLVDVQFVVREAMASSFSVSRKLLAERQYGTPVPLP